MNKPDFVKILLITTWGLSGLFVGLMLSLLLLVSLEVKGWLLYSTIGLALLSGLCSAVVRRLALWYLTRKDDP